MPHSAENRLFELIDSIERPNTPFSSDTDAPIHPDVLAAMQAANTGSAPPYGRDRFSTEAGEMIAALFGAVAPAQVVFGGTGANLLGLATMVGRGRTIICTDISHINMDEAGACEARLGCKLVPVASMHGKLTSEQVADLCEEADPVHSSIPAAISISLVTEVGTIYSPDEIRDLARVAGQYQLGLQVDGARFAYAAIAYPETIDLFAKIHADFGIPVSLVVGGTKFGMMMGEAIVSFGTAIQDVPNIARGLGQLPAKSRFIGAQFLALFTDELWKKVASDAAAASGSLAKSLNDLGAIDIALPPANSVYPRFTDADKAHALQRWTRFALWQAAGDCRYRLMTHWATSQADVDRLSEAIRRLHTDG